MPPFPILGRFPEQRNGPFEGRPKSPFLVLSTASSDHCAGGRRFLRRETATAYGLVFFFGAGVGVLAFPVVPAFPVFPVFPVSPPLLSKVRASFALKGKRRTDCSPVVLRVTSTRRLLARRTVSRFFRIFCFSAALRSGSVSIRFLTSSEVMFFSKPNARVSMCSAGTPFSTR